MALRNPRPAVSGRAGRLAGLDKCPECGEPFDDEETLRTHINEDGQVRLFHPGCYRS